MFEMFEDFAKQNEEADKERQGESAEETQFSQAEQFSREVPSKGPIFVVSAGGSIFFGDKPFTTKIAKFCETINRLHSQGHRFVIVAGGGKVTRNYVASIKSFGADHFRQDQLGIMFSRANALLLLQALDNSFHDVLTEPKRALGIIESGRIPVFGGLFPLFTTDAVATLICEAIGGEFVNLTDVDGVYSADPKKSSHSKFFETISYEKLISLIKLADSKPAQNMVLDMPACLILKRSKIKGIVLNGENLENFEAMVRGEDFKGTIIRGNDADGSPLNEETQNPE